MLAVWSLVRAAAGDQADRADSGQPGDAKTQVCDAFNTVRNAVSLQTNADLGKDRVAKQAVAANARLATLGGGQFLLSRLTDAVPTDLADAVRSFANDLEYIGMGQLAGAAADDPAQTGSPEERSGDRDAHHHVVRVVPPHAGTNSTPASATASSRSGATTLATNRPSSFQTLIRNVSPGNTTPAMRAP